MGFEQLLQILKENKQVEAEVEVCPECLWPNLKQNSKGQKHCPICGWTEN